MLALLVILIWGSNFVVAKVGLHRIAPLSLATLRFAFSAFPAIFFVRRPGAPWAVVALFGLVLGLFQFGLLFLGMSLGVSAGLAALVIQVQAFFTIGLALVLLKERPRMPQLGALAVAAAGIALIFRNSGGSSSAAGLALVLAAALAWAACNLIVKAARPGSMLGFLAWSSLFAVPPLLACSAAAEGLPPLELPFVHPDPELWFVILWQSAANTLLGFGIWNSLLGRYEASRVAPLSLLVPVVAMLLSWAALGEPMQAWKLAAAALVVAGLGINTFAPAARR